MIVYNWIQFYFTVQFTDPSRDFSIPPPQKKRGADNPQFLPVDTFRAAPLGPLPLDVPATQRGAPTVLTRRIRVHSGHGVLAHGQREVPKVRQTGAPDETSGIAELQFLHGPGR